MEEKYTVYKHICPNGKIYIGITSNPLWQRFKNGRGYESQLFGSAIKKYGWENISHEILFSNLVKSEAEEKEIELIEKHQSTNIKYGYNVDVGGNAGRKLSARTKQKISEKKKGVKKSAESIEKQRQKMIGRKIPIAQIEKMRISHKLSPRTFSEKQRKEISDRVSGRNHPMYGKHHTEETRQKMSIAQKSKKHKTMTNETKMKLSQLRIQRKPIIQYDKNMVLIREYDCVHSIKIELGFDPTPINRCAKGKQKTSYGYIWKYKNEEDVQNGI